MSSNSINKRDFWRFVNKKLNRRLNHYHVFSVISILFEEMIKDLKDGKSIKIFNFGTLSLKRNKPRKYFDVNHQKVMLSKSHRILRFVLSPIIKKKLCRQLDKSQKEIK